MKDTFFKSIIILLIGGAFTKILGMVIKIIINRTVGIESMSLYMLIFPTFSLFMTFSQLGLPTALSKLISEEKHNNKKIMGSIITLSLIYNLFLMIIVILLARVITHLLNDERAFFPIVSISLVLPFDSISNIFRGYFFGKQRLIPHIISLLTEQLVRLSFILFFVPKILYKGNIFVVSTLVLINMISELISSIVLLSFIKEKKISVKDLIIDNNEVKKVFKIALPTTGTRLIGAISYFIEPMIITTCLINRGISSNFIIEQYGIIEGYVLPILLLPSFLTNALSGAIIPNISKKYSDNKKEEIKYRIKQIIGIAMGIGITSSIIIHKYSRNILNILYKTNKGTNYLKILSIFFIIHYIETPLESILLAINKSKKIMINNFIGISIKLLTIFLLSFFNIGLYNLIIAIILNISITTLLHVIELKKALY